MKGLLAAAIAAVSVYGCFTPSKPSYEASEVIERIEGSDETPDYARGDKTMWEEGGNVVFAHITTLQGNARPEACMKASGLSAKAELLKHIKENITTSGQLNELSASDDPGYESLTAFLSQGTLSSAKVDSQYWDRREESDATTGERILRLRCAAKVTISKAALAKMMRDATTKGDGNPEIREKLLGAQKQFIDGLSQQPTH